MNSYDSLFQQIKFLNQKICCLNNFDISQPVGQVVYGDGTGITSDAYFTRSNINTGGDGSTSMGASPLSGVVTLVETGQCVDLGSSLGSALIHSDSNTNKAPFAFVGDSNGFLGGITDDAAVLGVSNSDGTNFTCFKVDDNGIGWVYNNAIIQLPTNALTAGKILVSTSSNQLTWDTIHALLSLVPSYANNTAAVSGGLVTGNTYYNSTSNTYTRVI
jgi:hypothetical protein